ncbi:hypothetical protein RhiirA5_426203 [Rhizophagus irregularis]|uniref:HECT domain-containing protein n=1 Tax=Rhizophagus irregularis TaxID=588596 RepID=A0A2N0P4L7_9GLOM|nr:hypothetical protein RhiirA5_426203 [Rhizophagus irregularis]CAB5201749.1 unnamed protein product [Rhizophagus irregularis]
MDYFKNLPRKCYACEACQKFTPESQNEGICLICGHYEAQHEQFIELQLQNLISERPSTRRNSFEEIAMTEPKKDKENKDDVSTFLREMCIRDRLVMTNNNEINNIEANIPISLHNHDDLTTSFKCTMKIIMMPYTVNNKIVKLHSSQWADLQFHGLIKEVTFKDGSPEIINRTMVREFPKINDYGWQILRPKDDHSNELIPFKFSGPITGQIMKSACTARKRCYIGPTQRNIFDRALASNSEELIRITSNISTSIPLPRSTMASQIRPIQTETYNPIYGSNIRPTAIPQTIPTTTSDSIRRFNTIRPTAISQPYTNSQIRTTTTRSIRIPRSDEVPISHIRMAESSSTMMLPLANQDSYRISSNYVDSRSTDQFREDLLKSLRDKHHIDELETYRFHMEAEHCLEYFMNWILTARIEDLIKTPIIVLEDAVDTGGVFRDMTTILWQKIRYHTEFNGGKLFENDLIQQNSELIEWDYATSIGKLLFWTFIHFGSWPKWLKEIHMQYVIGGTEYVSSKNALYEHNMYLYNLSERIRNDGWRRHESDIRFWIHENNLNDEILHYENNNLSNYIAEYEILFKRQKSLEMIRKGFDISRTLNDIKKFNWFKIECELYSALTSDEFFKQIDRYYIDMSICEIPSKRKIRERIYGWFKEWVTSLDNETVERLLKFITGTTRIPLPKKINIQWRYALDNQTSNKTIYNKLPFSRTCSYTLILCEEYENFEELVESFKISLYNSEGFSEISYNRIKNLVNNSSTIDINDRELNNIQRVDIINDEQDRDLNNIQRVNIINEEQEHEIVQRVNTINEEQQTDEQYEEQWNEPQESMDNVNGSNFTNESNDSEYNNMEIIDLTSNDQINIDIHRETIGQEKKRKKQKRLKNTKVTIQPQSNHDQFINVTAEDIANTSNGNRKKKKPTQNIRSRIYTRSMARED